MSRGQSRFTWGGAGHIEQAWGLGGQEPGRVDEFFPRIPMTSGPLGLGLVPAGIDTVPCPAAGEGRGNVLAQPLLHLLSGPEAGRLGSQASSSCSLHHPAWGTGLSPLLGMSSSTTLPCYLTYFTHRPCLLDLNSPVLPEKLREVK